jgi:hypothetical protein
MSKTVKEIQEFSEKLKITLDLAAYISGYLHHSGYPVYDGGHTQPEETCEHPDCKAVREVIIELQADL